MLPDGVVYHAFQVMEAADREALEPWIAAWKDLVDFEVVPVQTSAEYRAAGMVE